MVRPMCIHNRVLYTCIPCKGGGICEHNIRRSRCKLCGGGSLCEHERVRSRCKECGDEIHITIMKWIYHSKQNDKKYNRYDEINFIDYDFCK